MFVGGLNDIKPENGIYSTEEKKKQRTREKSNNISVTQLSSARCRSPSNWIILIVRRNVDTHTHTHKSRIKILEFHI